MHNCEYCNRELKSNAGKLAHERSCKARDIGGQLEVDIINSDNTDVFDIIEPNKVVPLEVMNGASTYYMGHPRRLIKLKGLMSRTHDKRERAKIYNMILDVQSATH